MTRRYFHNLRLILTLLAPTFVSLSGHFLRLGRWVSVVELKFEGLAELRPMLSNLSQFSEGLSVLSEKVSSDIKAIYGMGYFSDVSVFTRKKQGLVRLIYKVVEKPAVRKVLIEGNDNVLTTTSRKSLISSHDSKESKIKRNVQKI